MNSMNYISAIGSSTASPSSSSASSLRNRSVSENSTSKENLDPDSKAQVRKTVEEGSDTAEHESFWRRDHTDPAVKVEQSEYYGLETDDTWDEKTPLLGQNYTEDLTTANARTFIPLSRRVGGAVSGTFRFIISAILAPGRYLVACFYDEHGKFSAALPFLRLGKALTRRQRRKKGAPHASGSGSQGEKTDGALKREGSAESSSTPSGTAESRLRGDKASSWGSGEPLPSLEEDSPSQHTRSKSSSSSDADSESSAPKRSTRIKIMGEDAAARQRKQRRDQRGSEASTATNDPSLTAAQLKSPTSPGSSLALTKYPRVPAPPRPLIPRRQPSYTSSSAPTFNTPPKTLIIDLDETLIHSMAKGGRMSTGHMVEVKLQQPVGIGGAYIGPQVPILYYVHKRPHCDEFLRKVSKWYNLIVFTASVQEYADPVIDWLELERKYFSARYYRQHCTYRNGAYIKDLSQVEPDLSKVIILDNSPMSYIFHEDNAIPIEGWISDPTDNDLLHLIPLFEGLQHTTDVRALLALRLGESISS